MNLWLFILFYGLQSKTIIIFVVQIILILATGSYFRLIPVSFCTSPFFSEHFLKFFFLKDLFVHIGGGERESVQVSEWVHTWEEGQGERES